MGNTVDERGNSSGIGDLTLMSQYRFFNDPRTGTEMAVLLGIKVFTGATGVNDAFGGRFEAEFQPGSGSWDGLFGLAFTKRMGTWSFDANVLYQLSTTGTQDTDLGDRFLYNAAVSYRLFGGASAPGRMNAGAPIPEPMYHGGPKGKAHHHHHEEPPAPRGPALDLVLEVNGEWHAHEVIGGVKEPNSGGHVVYLSPGVRYSLDNWSAFASVGLPIVNEVNGVQAEPDWRLLDRRRRQLLITARVRACGVAGCCIRNAQLQRSCQSGHLSIYHLYGHTTHLPAKRFPSKTLQHPETIFRGNDAEWRVHDDHDVAKNPRSHRNRNCRAHNRYVLWFLLGQPGLPGTGHHQ